VGEGRIARGVPKVPGHGSAEARLLRQLVAFEAVVGSAVVVHDAGARQRLPPPLHQRVPDLGGVRQHGQLAGARRRRHRVCPPVHHRRSLVRAAAKVGCQPGKRAAQRPRPGGLADLSGGSEAAKVSSARSAAASKGLATRPEMQAAGCTPAARRWAGWGGAPLRATRAARASGGRCSTGARNRFGRAAERRPGHTQGWTSGAAPTPRPRRSGSAQGGCRRVRREKLMATSDQSPTSHRPTDRSPNSHRPATDQPPTGRGMPTAA
jgi:hypothetical protein